jgi:prepilin-type N-terminal cleavage/methylation domain-containing protein
MVKMTESASIIRKRLRSARGFTLIELLVVCLVAGILGGAMLGLYEGLVRSWADTGHRIIDQDDARTAINEISRYIRMAESSASNLTSTSDAVALAQPQELVFYADIDGIGAPEKVRYYLSGKTLRMATLAADTSTSPPTYPTSYASDGVVIMDGVQNGTTPLFTYYKMNPAYASNPVAANDTLVLMTNPTSAADLTSIVAVGIKIFVNDTPVGVSKGNVSLDTTIQIRQRYNGGLSGG